MTKRDFLIIDDYGVAPVEAIRAWVEKRKQTAREDILACIDARGSAYSAELQKAVCLALSVPEVQKLLRQMGDEGVLSSELVDPPFEGEPRAQHQRRYYFRKEA